MSDTLAGQPYSVQLDYTELRNVVGCFATPGTMPKLASPYLSCPSLSSASFAPTTAVPIRIGLTNRGVSFRQLLRDVYTELLQAIEHANVPLFRIVEVFRPERSDTHNALFQTIIQLLPRTEHDTAGPTESDGRSGGHQLQGIDLFLNLVKDTDSSFDGSLTFNANIFDRSTADTFVVLLTSLLRDAVEAADAPMHDVLASTDAVATRCPTNVARRLELIRNGNQTFSPFEIEDALRRGHEEVSDVVAFPTPDRELGEVVGVPGLGGQPLIRHLRN